MQSPGGAGLISEVYSNRSRANRLEYGKFQLNVRKNFHCRSDKLLERGPERMSIPGGVQNVTGHRPWQPALAALALRGDLD